MTISMRNNRRVISGRISIFYFNVLFCCRTETVELCLVSSKNISALWSVKKWWKVTHLKRMGGSSSSFFIIFAYCHCLRKMNVKRINCRHFLCMKPLVFGNQKAIIILLKHKKTKKRSWELYQSLDGKSGFFAFKLHLMFPINAST